METSGKHVDEGRFRGISAWVVLGLAGFTAIQAPPFYSNQNQYMAHAVDAAGSQLAHDWFIGTTDPYPIFTSLAGAILRLMGLLGFEAASIAVLSVAWIAFGLIVAGMSPAHAHAHAHAHARRILVASALAIGVAHFLGIRAVFGGLAGQGLVPSFAFFQPASFGVLLLLAFPLWHALATGDVQHHARRVFLIALALTMACCAVHPTYLAALAVGLLSAFVANMVAFGHARLWPLVVIGLLVMTIALLANPAVVSVAGSDPDIAAALSRFAIERIPHHTLWWRWSALDAIYVVVVLAGAGLRYRRGDLWLATWLPIALALALLAAAVLPHVAQGRFTLSFPWRVSVILVPIAIASICIEVAGLIERVRGLPLTAAACAMIVALACLGGWRSYRVLQHRTLGPAIDLVRAVRPTGTGLVPLDQDGLRLNAGVAIYVDWKSPPYVGRELIEWWRRIDVVKSFTRDPCRAPLPMNITWLLMRADEIIPPCLAGWKIAGADDHWRIIARAPLQVTATPVALGHTRVVRPRILFRSHETTGRDHGRPFQVQEHHAPQGRAG